MHTLKTRRADVAVIGAGSAGLVAYRRAAAWTDNVVLIEGGPYGTTCARVGCMPSKLLIAAAETAHTVDKAAEFGIGVGDRHVDGTAVMDRIRRERDRFVGFVIQGVQRIPESERIRGHARFLDDHRLQVDKHTIVEADRIVIATGSSPTYPKAWDSLGDRLIVSDDIFDWKDLPKSVVVIGPGAIGLEIGQALHRLGVDISVLGLRGQVGPLTDPAVIEAAREAFANEYELDSDVDIQNLKLVDAGVYVNHADRKGNLQARVADYIVAATGRAPNVSGLALENTSLPLDERGIPLFDRATTQIGDSHVFIAGDVNDHRPLLHEAADEGRIAGENAGRYPDVRAGLRKSPISIVFSDPQIAMVGSAYSELERSSTVIGEASFEDQGRSRIMLQNCGMLRIYADTINGRFLGAEMAGPRAEHLAHLLSWAHQAGHSIATMLEMPFYHPVIEEGLRTALRDANSKLLSRVRTAA